ncbi:hypothetical protein H6788_00860 [Candidatus Nomurabacteria bacterium]|nr:hypothetical protein [Candidatus Nomurabacteria bacterium]MCB9819371.1 hypothetical protein [Candidatus Nomurabacteria bacterium]
MRFQVGIQITLLVVAIVIAVSVVKPKIDSIRIAQSEVAAYQTAMENIGRYNQHLQTLINQADALSDYDRTVLERYLPREIDATLVASDISNIVSRNQMLLLDIIPEKVIPVTTFLSSNSDEGSVSNEPSTVTPSGEELSENKNGVFMAQRFQVEVVGSYEQIKEMLRDLERNAYPLKLVEFEFNLEETNVNLIQYSLLVETYALPAN